MLVKDDQNQSGTLVQCGLRMTKPRGQNEVILTDFERLHKISSNFFDIEAILDPKSVLNNSKIVNLTNGI